MRAKRRTKAKKYIKALILCIAGLSLSACSNPAPQADQMEQVQDLEMVITAEQGRVQNLEKDISDLKVQLTGALKKIEILESTSASGPANGEMGDQVRRENAELVRLVFKSLTGEVDIKGMEGLISTYDNVYKLAKSPQEDKELIWVTGHEKSGDLYIIAGGLDDGLASSPIFLGRYENVSLAKWSPDNEHVIIETENEGQKKGYLIDSTKQETLASMEYTGLPIWSADGAFFVYLNDNPNELYTGTETANMYATGVFMYSFKSQSFSIIDPGGSDYICKDLGVKTSGEITYIQKFKDGKESYTSVLID